MPGSGLIVVFVDKEYGEEDEATVVRWDPFLRTASVVSPGSGLIVVVVDEEYGEEDRSRLLSVVLVVGLILSCRRA